MGFFKKSTFHKKVSFSKIAILVIILATIWFQLFGKRLKQEVVIRWDVISYYAYLPATFIYNDLTLKFIDSDKAFFDNKFWPSTTPGGKYVIKTTMGMSVMYSPFFAVAHLIAKPLGYEPNGFTLPYHISISIAALFYLVLGLVFLRKLLVKYFSEFSVAITLLLITLGTNLWWYSSIEPGMSHVYSFTLYVLFVFLIEKWLTDPSLRNSLLIGVLSGLITLVRPTNVIVGVFFILWQVASFSDLKSRVKFLFSKWNLLLVMIVSAVLVWLPQLVYWKVQTGNIFYNSYGEEGFFILSPKFIDGLFSYRKGLLLYTPVIGLAFIGLLLLKKYINGATKAILTFVVLNLYVIFSWWTWWYGGSYGARAVIESYAILAFPLAAFINWSFYQKQMVKIALLSFVLVLFCHSIFQSFQYYYGAIHWDSMTKEAYWFSFGKLKKHPSLDNYIRAPDYDKALKGIYVYQERPKTDVERIVYGDLTCDMETLDETGSHFLSTDGLVSFKDGVNQSNEKSRSGKYSLKVGPAAPFALAHKLGVMPNDTLYFEIWRSRKAPSDAGLVFSAQEPDKFYSRAISIVESDGDWDLIYQKLVIPNSYSDSLLLVYIWNPSKRVAYFDDFSMARAMERSNN